MISLLITFLLSAASARAQDGFASGYNPESNRASVGYDGWFLREADGAFIGLEQANIRVPVYSGVEHGGNLSVKGHRLRTGETVTIKDRGFSVPQELGNLDVGGSWAFAHGDGSSTGGILNYGASGSRLLDRQEEREMNITGFYRTVENEGGAWIYAINYSNNRTILNNIPLPVFAYSYVSGKSLRVVAGLPFFVVYYAPIPRVSILATGTLSGIGGEVASFLVVPVQAYVGWSWNGRVYQNVVPGDLERLFYEVKEVSAGVRVILGRTTRASIGYVYQYHRNFFVSDSLLSRANVRESVNDASGLNLRVAIGF